MDELIQAIADRTGLPVEKAKDAAQAAIDYLKDKLPAPVASQIDGFLSGSSDAIGDAVAGVTDKLKGMFGKDRPDPRHVKGRPFGSPLVCVLPHVIVRHSTCVRRGSVDRWCEPTRTEMSMKALFVDESHALQEVRALIQKANLNLAAAFVSDANEAEQTLQRTTFDILVAGIGNGSAAGTQIVSVAEAAHPEVARLALVSDPRQARHVSAHSFIRRPFTVQTLQRAMHGTCRWRDSLGKLRVSELIDGARRLPSLPDVYLRLRQEINSGDPSLKKVGEIVRADPGISVEILKIVNSPLYGLRQEVGDITHASALLGLQTVNSLVLATGVFSVKTNLGQRFVRQLWMESLRVGAIARHIAQAEGLSRVDVEESQLAGLLHDVGQIIFMQNWPDDFLAVDPTNQEVGEIRQFGTTHGDVGGFLCSLWELPDGVIDTVTHHHRPSDSKYASVMSPTTAVHVARALVDAGWDRDGVQVDMEHLERIGRAGRLEEWQAIAGKTA